MGMGHGAWGIGQAGSVGGVGGCGRNLSPHTPHTPPSFRLPFPLLSFTFPQGVATFPSPLSSQHLNVYWCNATTHHSQNSSGTSR